MKASVKIITVVIGVILATGCASTKLQVNLDLYKEDPYIETPLTETQITKMTDGLHSVESQAVILAKDRIELAEKLYSVYETIFFATSKLLKPDYTKAELKKDIALLNGYLQEYKKAVTEKLNDIKVLIHSSRFNLTAYTKPSHTEVSRESNQGESKKEGTSIPTSKDDVINSVRKVYLAFIELGGSLGTDFEGKFVKNWSTVSKSITEKNLRNFVKTRKTPKVFDDLRSEVDQLSQSIEALRLRGYDISKEASDTLKEIAQANVARDPSAMKKTIDAIADVATNLPDSIGIGDRGTTALNELLQSTTLLYSQIDRLQDPADPIWRVVSDPANEPKWNTKFSETYFYAEGNSSIVVVRDTPMSFRPQYGQNNPAALVQSQLQISRAIGNAAISVAAVATGLPISQITGQGTGGSPATKIEESPEAEELAKRKARIEQQVRIRELAVRNMRNNLLSLKEDFLTNGSKRKVLLQQLTAILKANAPIFKPASEK
jgi:hypothetical protein